MKNLIQIKTFYKHWETARKKLPYATDGVVLKVNQFTLQDLAGSTQKAPRWAIALKYPAEEAPSKLLRLTCQVGRTGAITPVVEFEPIPLGGTMVSRASLHNADRLKALDLHQNDTIVIRKAGEIIPEVVSVVEDLRPAQAARLKVPEHCPECQSLLIKEENAAVTLCINMNCPAILRGTIRHWVSKGAMDIEGLGEKLIEQLVKLKVVNSIADLYKIDVELLSSLERMGAKSAKNIVLAIEASKKQPWYRQLYGLGINHVGEVNAKTLVQAFPNISDLSNAACSKQDLLTPLFGIGIEIIDSLNQWFNTSRNQALINELKNVGLTFRTNQKALLAFDNELGLVKQSLKGQRFVITGTLPSLTRNEVIKLIESAGGKIISSVSPKTTFLIAGEQAGSKLKKAISLDIPIINEKKLLELIKSENL